MAEIWAKFLLGETDIRQGGEDKFGTEALALRELNYKMYLLDRNTLKQKVQKLSMGINVDANQSLFDMSLLEDDVEPKYVFFILYEGLASASWRQCSISKTTAIHNFAKNCHFKALEILRDASFLEELPLDQNGLSPIHLALYYEDMRSTYEQEQTLKLLCSSSSRNSVVNLKETRNGKTALLLAFEQKSIRATKVILEHNASALINVIEFSKSIPLLKLLCNILFPVDVNIMETVEPWQQRLHMISSHPRLRTFLDPNSVSFEMVDYHSSKTWLSVQKLHRGKDYVINGMILYRIREELRASKRNISSVSSVLQIELDRERKEALQPTLTLDEKQKEKKQFEDDLTHRNMGQSVRKKHKGKTTKAKREHEEQLQWDRRMQTHKNRMENEYNVKISGLIVG